MPLLQFTKQLRYFSIWAIVDSDYMEDDWQNIKLIWALESNGTWVIKSGTACLTELEQMPLLRNTVGKLLGCYSVTYLRFFASCTCVKLSHSCWLYSIDTCVLDLLYVIPCELKMTSLNQNNIFTRIYPVPVYTFWMLISKLFRLSVTLYPNS